MRTTILSPLVALITATQLFFSLPLSAEVPLSPPRQEQLVTEERQSMAQLSFVTDWIHARHTAKYFGAFNDWVEFEDGTTFRIASYDRGTLSYWAEGDLIYILKGAGWFWSYDCRIYNATTGDIVDADLNNGPIPNGPYSLFIAAIDDFQGIIYLQNGSVLIVDSSDIHKLITWSPYDYVITATNDDWASYRSPNLLINAATKDFIRVSPY